MGYVKEVGLFNVKTKNISGKTIEGIKNKNIKQDTIEERKKQANQDPEFHKSAKEYFLLNWSLYHIQITCLSSDTLASLYHNNHLM